MLSDAFAGLQKLLLPDRWQALALTALREGRDVVVAAPTGAGKTYVFERWAEQANFAKRSLFTVPTRALANDKFAEGAPAPGSTNHPSTPSPPCRP